MNDQRGFFQDLDAAERCPNAHLLKGGTEAFAPFLTKIAGLRTALHELSDLGDEGAQKPVERLQKRLSDIEPSVTLIGQVKAGKTTLVNSMIGWPGLLPADVNPWTSVVTSIHLNGNAGDENVAARFRFFDKDDWDKLVHKGGRIGELASRAGADEELEKVREQIEKMRSKSSARLGRRFELLLGQEHAYGSFDQDLIARYVCLGDDFEGEAVPSEGQGRFADITKTADLYLQRPAIPLALCLRDTPGVNDTFLMREQITLRAIRDSRVCVVVLSAHQALTTVDMAMIRMIANVKAREVVIFVNRIDELSDPAAQVPEIRDSIRATLRKHDGPADAQIIFGSAYWAHHALMGSLEQMSETSRQALVKWAEEVLKSGVGEKEESLQAVWKLSGVPALYQALAERIEEGVGQEAIDRIAGSTENLVKGIEAAGRPGRHDLPGNLEVRLDRQALMERWSRLRERHLGQLDEAFSSQLDQYSQRLDRGHRSFLERATASLIEHLEKNGEEAVWTYEPTGLRMLMRSAYQAFGARVHAISKEALNSAAADIDALYGEALALPDGAGIEAPTGFRIPPPVMIGQTIALDVKGTWWRSWWQRRRGYRAFADSFRSMIMDETDPIVRELKEGQAALIRAEAVETLEEFLGEHRDILLGYVENAGTADQDRSGTPLQSDRRERLQSVRDMIAKVSAEPATGLEGTPS